MTKLRKKYPSTMLLEKSIDEIKSLKKDGASTATLSRRFHVDSRTMTKFLKENGVVK